MIEKIFGLISLFFFVLRYIDTDITTKVGKFKFFLFKLFQFVKTKIINSSKNKIVLIYYIYCITIYYLYQKYIIFVISERTISFDRINMIIFYFLILSAAFLEKNNKNNSGLFYDNIAFSFSNLIWLIYMLFRILFFLFKDIIKFCLEKFKILGWDLAYSSLFSGIISFGVFGNTLLFSALTSLTSVFGTIVGAGYSVYKTDDKTKKMFYMIYNHLLESDFFFLVKYAIIYLVNIVLLIILIIINIILKLKDNYKEFCLTDEAVNEERRKLSQKAKIKKFKK